MTMQVGVPNEAYRGEPRTAMVPANVARLVQLGVRVEVESGTGHGSGFADDDYSRAGAAISSEREAILERSDLILRVRPPTTDEVKWLKPGGTHLSFLDPFNSVELLHRLAGRGVNAISVELIPRITRAQKMDALSSQANLAGYVAVILAATQLNRIFPMMMTAAGTITPARVLVLGAGVAGLQAIATAHRLGARVEAYDTRPAVEEQVRSVGGKFLKIDLGETGQTQDGYAKPLSEAQIANQREALKRICAQADVLITTAQVFGRKAPVLVTAEMIAAMKAGSVVVDLAIESGGNVEGAVIDQAVERAGVKILGYSNLAGRVPAHASQVYSTNLTNLVEE